MKPVRWAVSRAGGCSRAGILPLLLLSAGLLVASSGPLSAQGGVSPGVLTLNHAQRLLDEGRIREARGELERWWIEHEEPDAAPVGELQRALWLRGLMTVDPQLAEVDFRRLVREFAEGPYAGSARLRLAQAAFAQGRTDEAREHYRALDRDYPGSALRLEARTWLDRHGGVPADDPEPEVTPEMVIRPDDTAHEVRSASTLSVELGAFRDSRVADELRDRARSAGLVVRVVPRPNGTFSVRVGRLRHFDDARSLRDRCLTLGFQARLVPAEPSGTATPP